VFDHTPLRDVKRSFKGGLGKVQPVPHGKRQRMGNGRTAAAYGGGLVSLFCLLKEC